MALQPWELLVVACTAMGGLALATRHAVRLWGQHQVARLARENHALQRWWAVIADLPAFCLEPPVRRAIGRLMYRRLECARRIRPDHPFLHAQRLQIARFIGHEQPAGPAVQSRHARDRTIAALRELIELLREGTDRRLLSSDELVTTEAAVWRRLTELEFVQSQHSMLQADYLHRVTQAIAPGGAAWPQLGGSSSALPTQ